MKITNYVFQLDEKLTENQEDFEVGMLLKR